LVELGKMWLGLGLHQLGWCALWPVRDVTDCSCSDACHRAGILTLSPASWHVRDIRKQAREIPRVDASLAVSPYCYGHPAERDCTFVGMFVGLASGCALCVGQSLRARHCVRG